MHQVLSETYSFAANGTKATVEAYQLKHAFINRLSKAHIQNEIPFQVYFNHIQSLKLQCETTKARDPSEKIQCLVAGQVQTSNFPRVDHIALNTFANTISAIPQGINLLCDSK